MKDEGNNARQPQTLMLVVAQSILAVFTLRFGVRDLFVVTGLIAFAISLTTSDGTGIRRVRVTNLEFSPDGTELFTEAVAWRGSWNPFGKLRKKFSQVYRTLARLDAERGRVMEVLEQSLVKRGPVYTSNWQNLQDGLPRLQYLDGNRPVYLDGQGNLKNGPTKLPPRPIVTFDVSEDGEFWIYADSSDTVFLYDATTEQEDVFAYTPAADVGVTPDGSRFFIRYRDHIVAFDSESRKHIATFDCGNIAPQAHWLDEHAILVSTWKIDTSLDFDSLAVRRFDNANAATGAVSATTTATATSHFHSATAFGSGTIVSYDRNSQSIAVCDSNLLVERSLPYQAQVHSLAINHDGQRIAIGGNGTVTLFDRNGNRIWKKRVPARYRPHMLFYFGLLFIAGRGYIWWQRKQAVEEQA